MILIEIANLYTWAPLSRTTRIGPLLAYLTKEQGESLLDEFGHYILYFLKSSVRHAIKNQGYKNRRFNQIFEPLNPKYLARKKRRGHNEGFWTATGYLERYLQTWRTPEGNLAIGFKDHIEHPRHPHRPKLVDIVRTIELGDPSRGIPARPLFGPIVADIRKGIYRDHFLRFMEAKHPQWRSLLP